MQIHPVRATLAITGWLATIAFLWLGVGIPDAWWAIVAVVSTFYFVGSKESSEE